MKNPMIVAGGQQNAVQCYVAEIWLEKEEQNDPDGDQPHDGQRLECDIVYQCIGQHGMDGADQFA